jgi:hypothetical protein
VFDTAAEDIVTVPDARKVKVGLPEVEVFMTAAWDARPLRVSATPDGTVTRLRPLGNPDAGEWTRRLLSVPVSPA